MSSISERELVAIAGPALAGLGSAVVLIGLISSITMGIGVALLVLGTILAAPYASNPGRHLGEWWSVLALAAMLALVGFGLGLLASVPGDLMATIGAVTAIVAVGLAVPVEG